MQAARETGALKEAKDKLEKRVEELTWRLEFEKHLRVYISINYKYVNRLAQVQLHKVKKYIIKAMWIDFNLLSSFVARQYLFPIFIAYYHHLMKKQIKQMAFDLKHMLTSYISWCRIF